MSAHFSISVDRQRDLVRIVMTGLFMAEDVADFVRERRHKHALLLCPPHQRLSLCDLRAMKISPQQTVAAFGALLADPESRARRLAFVVAPTLVRSQLMRALAGRHSRCFTDPAEAEAWLLENRAEANADADADSGIVLPFRRVA